MGSRILEQIFFRICEKVHDFLIVFYLFWDTISIDNIFPLGKDASGLIGGTLEPKTNYMLNFNNNTDLRY